jgi:hypothetical protein
MVLGIFIKMIKMASQWGKIGKSAFNRVQLSAATIF